ncbi:hypothetical protein [Streptomyces sp.]|uniref:hypothetical protein n=1 Tax=Streptomyces sp. TaxID=1931 RepID=UPI002D77FC96|nr:hypothetical protein [Streptomyces sp.]HET6360233.1 hypothetical protein [Streptomyces sp.]
MDDLKGDALRTGRENSLNPGKAYANAPGWSDEDSNYLDEQLVENVRNARNNAKGNSPPDPYEKP